jgi:hypothetical protein
MKPIQLPDIVNMEDPESVFSEVGHIALMISPQFTYELVDTVFRDIVRLFEGGYPGYRRCTTEYHDLKHTTDTLLAVARLMHGACVCGESFTREQVNLGLICALMHDTGYIQTLDDDVGTGAKYTLIHTERSVAFMDNYIADRGLSKQDFTGYPSILRCTGLSSKIRRIRFPSRPVELLGRILVAADLLGQMADRTYLEKLLFLFYEFREGGVMGYGSELELLKKTMNFYALTQKRFTSELDSVNGYMRYHFKSRWNLEGDLYREAIERNMSYLRFILENHEKDYREYLRRQGRSRSSCHESGERQWTLVGS